MAWTLAQLAEHVDGVVHGNGACVISAVATLGHASEGQISFLTNSLYKSYLKNTNASAVILKEDMLGECHTNAIVTTNPHVAYAKISQLLYPAEHPAVGVHPSAFIDPSAEIGEGVSIGPNVVIEALVGIGNNTTIGANSFIGRQSQIGANVKVDVNVTVHNGTTIGDRCIIFSGAVIGSDGFGYAYDKTAWVKIPQIGKVVIGDDVEIGASTTIDRGAIEDTVIGNGVKMDNQIQIGHNVHIGEHTVIAACAGIAGSAVVGKRCMIGGLSGIAGHLEITDDVIITAMSMVTTSINKPGTYSSALPAEPNTLWRRYVARFKQLDSFAKRLKALEKQVNDNGE